MRRRTELYWIGRGEAGPPSFRYPGHNAACPHAGDTRARYPAGWADDRSRFPGEIALRDMATADSDEQALVLARFTVSRWLHRLLTGAPAWELEAERKAAHDYVAMALPGNTPPAAPHEPGLLESAAATLRSLAEPPGPENPETLLSGLRQASAQAAALHQPGGALAMGRFGYLAALSLGDWAEARWFARELAAYVSSHGGDRLAGRWVRRARALERRLHDSTHGPG
jgi:hypothetical protein